MKQLVRNVMSLIFCLLLAVTLAACGASKDEKLSGEALVNAVLEMLCAPELRGRLVGTEGNEEAGKYLAETFKQIGLLPLIKSSFEWEYSDTVYDPDISNPTVKFICKDGEEIIPVNGEDFSFNIAYGSIDTKLEVTNNINEITQDKAKSMFLLTDETVKNLKKSENFQNVEYKLIFSYTRDNISIVPARHDFKDFSLVATKGFSNIIADKKIVSVEIKNKDSAKKTVVSNIVGYLKGKDSTKAVVVSCHFDGAGYLGNVYSKGAIDNASGTAAVVNIANMLSEKNDELAIDVIFCVFNSEEKGLIGSETFVKELKGFYDEIYNINIDCIGSKDNIPYSMDIRENGRDKELNEALREIFDSYNIPYNPELIFLNGDHAKFEAENIVNINIAQPYWTEYGGNDDNMIHTKNDVTTELDVSAINTLSRAVTDLIIKSVNNTYQTAVLPQSIMNGHSSTYSSLDEIRKDYPNININETVSDYGISMIKVENNGTTITLLYTKGANGISLTITKIDPRFPPIKNDYKQFEGCENYYYNEIINLADPDRKDTISGMTYFDDSVHVYFYESYTLDDGRLTSFLITSERAVEIIEFLNIHGKTDYYKSILDSLN